MVSPWGKIKLEKPGEDPEFGLMSFFAMMFSAGIAAGIVFWGPAEALKHYQTVPPLIGADPQSSAAAVGAIQYTLFHWEVSYWVPYLVVAIPTRTTRSARTLRCASRLSSPRSSASAIWTDSWRRPSA